MTSFIFHRKNTSPTEHTFVRWIHLKLESRFVHRNQVASIGHICDKESKTKAFGLLTKINSFDFIFATMFMKNVMYKMQLMIDTLQTEELDVSGALLVMAETKESLERIRKDESGVNNEVQAACSFAKQFDVDAEYDFRKIHRKRVPPRRLDEASETAADLTMASFYRKEVFTFVDTMSSVLSPKISSLEDSFRPLIDVLDPYKTPSTDKVVKLATVFPEMSQNQMHCLLK